MRVRESDAENQKRGLAERMCTRDTVGNTEEEGEGIETELEREREVKRERRKMGCPRQTGWYVERR